uniref:Uncharacterized protein n=1 Tax=Coptotermes formosanus TaxID=36987 RepID=R4UVA7_COPFO|nr:hypothetical protein [Coptotermes formosanus]
MSEKEPEQPQQGKQQQPQQGKQQPPPKEEESSDDDSMNAYYDYNHYYRNFYQGPHFHRFANFKPKKDISKYQSAEDRIKQKESPLKEKLHPNHRKMKTEVPKQPSHPYVFPCYPPPPPYEEHFAPYVSQKPSKNDEYQLYLNASRKFWSKWMKESWKFFSNYGFPPFPYGQAQNPAFPFAPSPQFFQPPVPSAFSSQRYYDLSSDDEE